MRRMAAAALTCALLSAPASGALPHADGGIVRGSGGYGGTADAGWRDVWFNGTATLAGSDGVLGTYGCSFQGAVFYTVAAEAGFVNGTCGPFTLGLCAYAREALAVDLACVPEPAYVGAITATGVYTPLNVNPTTHFDLVVALAGISDVKPVGAWRATRPPRD